MSKTNNTASSNQETETSAKAPERARVDSTYADTWKPVTKGEELSGKYLGYEDAPGRNNETFRAYQILTDTGRRSVAGAHLDSLLPQVPKGAHVWITYAGEKKLKNGDMALFELEVEKGVKLIDVMK